MAILEDVKQELPPEAEITDMAYEGSELIYYTKNKVFFESCTAAIKKLVSKFKKRIEIRADPSLLASEEQTVEFIKSRVPAEAGIKDIYFEPEFAKVVIHAEKPGVVIGKSGETLLEIKQSTCWMPDIRRAPVIDSEIIRSVRRMLHNEAGYRKKFLNETGKKIYSPGKDVEWIRVTALGAFRQVGKSAVLVQTPQSKVLLDCGIDVSASGTRPYPYLDAPEFQLQALDAVVISHAHLDHCLPPDTPVLLANRTMKPIKDVKEGDMLLSMDQKTGKLVPSACTARKDTFSHKRVYKVRTPYFNVEASPNHRFFVVKNMELVQVKAEELAEGMMLPATFTGVGESSPVPLEGVDYRERISMTEDMKDILRKRRTEMGITQEEASRALGMGVNFISDVETKYSHVSAGLLHNVMKFYSLEGNIQETAMPETLLPELSQLAGYMLGDGGKSSDYSIRITDSSIPCLEYYAELTRKIFGHAPVVRHHSDKTKNAHVLEINNAGIVRFMEKNFSPFGKSRERTVPKKIFYSSQRSICAFLRGIADAEGSVSENSVSISSYSHALLDEIQTLLAFAGIPASVSYRDNRVKVASSYGVLAFKENVGFSHPGKTEKLEKLAASAEGTKSRHSNAVPVSPEDIRRVLQDAGILGRVHKSPKIKELPAGLVSLLHAGKGYAERKTAETLYDVLARRLSELTDAKAESIWAKRLAISVTREELFRATGISKMQIQLREEKSVRDAITARLDSELSRIICEKMSKTEENLRKIRFLLGAAVTWQTITSIEKRENPYEYLVDIEVKETENFIANGMIVHNCGFVPYLYEYGYRGPLYCTRPTRDTMVLLQLDYVQICQRENKKPPYTSKGIEEMLKHCIPLEYGEVSDVTPDIRLTLNAAGHILGSATSHLNIGNGQYNFLYTGDIKYEDTKMFDKAFTDYARVECVLIEGTYGAKTDTLPAEDKGEEYLIAKVREVKERGGKVIIPSFAVGRAQEVIAMLMDSDIDMPLYLDGMLWDATAINTAYPEFMSVRMQKKILHLGKNPFLDARLKGIGSQKERLAVIESQEPCVILATSGMLVGGPIMNYLEHFAGDERNALLFVGYQAEGTMGRRIQKGWKRIQLDNGRSIELKLEVGTVKGLSGHSDFSQLMAFIGSFRAMPKKILVNHCENTKCVELAKEAHKYFGVETMAPKLLETVRLK
ncbi:MAG: MBL fold metallo-hydrolase [Candidatus Aenigmarchaeota archaeon]|nr:MBL fold metallo-hydrolase [Candidatus Aenigmarchaeota archaeon]